MKKILLASITLAAILGASAAIAGIAPQAGDPAVLLRAAIEKEEVDGDLQGAIALYKQIVAKYSDQSAVAAKAQLRIGMCYEKLGNAEAVKAYEAVLSRFPKEAEAVAQARSRLAALRREEPARLTVTRLSTPGMDLEGQTLSPDGLKLAGFVVNKEGQNLAVYDLLTAKMELLTHYVWSLNSCSTYAAAWSPDGKEIVHWAACSGGLNKSEMQLRITGLDGKSRILFNNAEAGVAPCAWLPDGSAVAAFVQKKDGSFGLSLISTQDGACRELCPLQRRFGVSDLLMAEASRSADVSPDGRLVVFSDGPSDNSRDIFVVSSQGGPPLILTDHPSDDKEPRWSPDGRHIVFLSLRHGSWALWGIAVKDGKPDGLPFLVLEGMQNDQLASWTKKGLVSLTEAVIHDLYTVEIDPESHELEGKPRAVNFSPSGTNSCAAWSPDGRYLAFISFSVDQPSEGYVAVLPAAGGAARTYRIPTGRFESVSLHDLRWLPDSSGLGFSHFDSDNHYSLFRLDLASGKWKTWPIPDAYFSSIEWGGDGKTFIYARGAGDPAKKGLVERNLENGQERYLLHAELGPPYTWPMKASRDYKKLVRASDGKIELIDKATGKVVKLEWEKERLGMPAWSPDGKYIVAPGRRSEETGLNNLFIISISDGKLKALNFEPYLRRGSWIMYPDWSPDGKRIAFHTRSFSADTNLITNLIPKK
jgi:Tol biopolymer transport system component